MDQDRQSCPNCPNQIIFRDIDEWLCPICGWRRMFSPVPPDEIMMGPKGIRRSMGGWRYETSPSDG